MGVTFRIFDYFSLSDPFSHIEQIVIYMQAYSSIAEDGRTDVCYECLDKTAYWRITSRESWEDVTSGIQQGSLLGRAH